MTAWLHPEDTAVNFYELNLESQMNLTDFLCLNNILKKQKQQQRVFFFFFFFTNPSKRAISKAMADSLLGVCQRHYINKLYLLSDFNRYKAKNI